MLDFPQKLWSIVSSDTCLIIGDTSVVIGDICFAIGPCKSKCFQRAFRLFFRFWPLSSRCRCERSHRRRSLGEGGARCLEPMPLGGRLTGAHANWGGGLRPTYAHASISPPVAMLLLPFWGGHALRTGISEKVQKKQKNTFLARCAAFWKRRASSRRFSISCFFVLKECSSLMGSLFQKSQKSIKRRAPARRPTLLLTKRKLSDSLASFPTFSFLFVVFTSRLLARKHRMRRAAVAFR